LFVAGLINRFVIVPLRKAQNTSAFNMQDTIGIHATVISPIPRGGYGKIRYNISGSVVTSPAKSEDGGEVRAGEQVDIVYVEKNTYFVRHKLNDKESNRNN
jgi:membrane protein implicated in regulation of membrane protease activity